MKQTTLLRKIGNTPCKKLDSLFPEYAIYLKLEYKNPSASIKDRAAKKMIEVAIQEKKLTKNHYILEASSGNLGIALAMIGRELKIPVKIVMPESMSIERRDLIRSYGGKLILTSADKGMQGAIDACLEIAKKDALAWMPNQFQNPSNRLAHEETTAREILHDFPKLDILVGGIGSSGHMSACSKVLKENFSKLQSFAVEPFESQVLVGKEKGVHDIQGIGAGFVPSLFERELFDDIISVRTHDAYTWTKRLMNEENLSAGPSTGANLAAISWLIKEGLLRKENLVLSFAYDDGSKYLSIK